MARKKFNYSTEFKHGASRLVFDKQHAVTEACNVMGICSERRGIASKAKVIESEHRNIQGLEARMRQILPLAIFDGF